MNPESFMESIAADLTLFQVALSTDPNDSVGQCGVLLAVKPLLIYIIKNNGRIHPPIISTTLLGR